MSNFQKIIKALQPLNLQSYPNTNKIREFSQSELEQLRKKYVERQQIWHASVVDQIIQEKGLER